MSYLTLTTRFEQVVEPASRNDQLLCEECQSVGLQLLRSYTLEMCGMVGEVISCEQYQPSCEVKAVMYIS